MNNKNISLQVFKFLFAIIVFIVVTSDRNLLIKYYIDYRANVVIISIFLLIILFIYLLDSIMKGSIKYKRYTKSLLIILFISSIYFLLHNVLYPTSLIPIKYSMLSIIIIIFITKIIDLNRIIKIFGLIGVLLSLAVILQQFLLLLFHGGSISEFNILMNPTTDYLLVRWSDGYVAPYGLGLIEKGHWPMNLGYIEYNRPSLFTHEPKYASSIILLTLSTVLLSNYSLKSKKIMIGIHLIAIIMIAAVTGYVVLIITLVIYLTNKKYSMPKYYTSAVLFLPFIFPWVVEYLLMEFVSSYQFIYLKLMGVASISGTGVKSIPSLFGRGAYGGVQDDSDTVLYYIYGQYGLIALILVALILAILISYIRKQSLLFNYSPFDRVALILLVNIFVLYNLYVFSDYLNLFSTIIVCFLFHIIEKYRPKHVIL